MPKVKLARSTRYRGVRRAAGDVVEVDDTTAERWQENGLATAQAAGGKAQGKGGKLPEGFPGLAALNEAGIATRKDLAKVEDLTSIPGVGEATAAEIKAALSDEE